MLDHDLVELAHQPLVRAEHDGADRARTGVRFAVPVNVAGSLSRKQAPNPSSTVR